MPSGVSLRCTPRLHSALGAVPADQGSPRFELGWAHPRLQRFRKHQVWTRAATFPPILPRPRFYFVRLHSSSSSLCRHPVFVPADAELTLRLGWAPRATDLSIVGDNLLHAHHPEIRQSHVPPPRGVPAQRPSSSDVAILKPRRPLASQRRIGIPLPLPSRPRRTFPPWCRTRPGLLKSRRPFLYKLANSSEWARPTCRRPAKPFPRVSASARTRSGRRRPLAAVPRRLRPWTAPIARSSGAGSVRRVDGPAISLFVPR